MASSCTITYKIGAGQTRRDGSMLTRLSADAPKADPKEET